MDKWGDIALRPKDGYRAEAINSEVDNTLFLYVTFTVGGEFKFKEEVTSWTNPTSDDIAECCRYELLVDALCRFFNTGGTLSDARYVFMRIRNMVKRSELGTLEIPGFKLVHSRQAGDPIYEHVFANEDTGEVIEWREGEYVDLMDGHEMKRKLDEENETET